MDLTRWRPEPIRLPSLTIVARQQLDIRDMQIPSRHRQPAVTGTSTSAATALAKGVAFMHVLPRAAARARRRLGELELEGVV
jgi:hypothetical protein